MQNNLPQNMHERFENRHAVFQHSQINMAVFFLCGQLVQFCSMKQSFKLTDTLFSMVLDVVACSDIQLGAALTGQAHIEVLAEYKIWGCEGNVFKLGPFGKGHFFFYIVPHIVQHLYCSLDALNLYNFPNGKGVVQKTDQTTGLCGESKWLALALTRLFAFSFPQDCFYGVSSSQVLLTSLYSFLHLTVSCAAPCKYDPSKLWWNLPFWQLTLTCLVSKYHFLVSDWVFQSIQAVKSYFSAVETGHPYLQQWFRDLNPAFNAIPYHKIHVHIIPLDSYKRTPYHRYCNQWKLLQRSCDEQLSSITWPE